MNILIIEDEKRNFNWLKRLLEEMDGTFRIDGPLASIVEAVEWLQTHPAPNLILADIRLSDGLSFDCCDRQPCHHLSFLLLHTTSTPFKPSSITVSITC